MEHHLRWDEGQHIKGYDKPEPEVTPETEVVSTGCLVGGSLGMKNFVNVRVHHTSLQMQVCCYRSQELGKAWGK